jgi:hypothetical protein
MPYYPKSRVITNQKANPGQFTLPNGDEYTGLYYTTFDNKSFIGATPTTTSIPLTPVIVKDINANPEIKTTQVLEYDGLKPSILPNLVDPTPFTPRPTEADYKAGKITRYFARQRNGTTFRLMEIDQTTYNAFTSGVGDANTSLWKVVSIFWQISGPLYNEKVNNITTRAGIINTNQRILNTTEPNFIGIKQYLTDLKQFAN